MDNNTGDYTKTIESETILAKLSLALEDYALDSVYNDFASREELEKLNN